MRRILCLAAPIASAAVAASALPLASPIDCVLGEDCHIQQFTDRDPGPGARDYMCGPLSYDGHKGTDFALPTDADIARDVPVLAAAHGVVTAIRDEMPDLRQGRPDAPDVSGRECGNGVVLDHGDGWETQYCHLKRGSVAVLPGQAVAQGTVLGAIGLSGQTEFPHLHLSVRRDGAVVDPFDPSDTAICGAAAAPLWTTPMPYTAGAILDLGWSDAVPDFDEIKSGTAGATMPVATSPALVLWVYAFGGMANDTLRIRWDGPDEADFETTTELDRDQARYFRAAGRRTPGSGWPAGTYLGTVELVRDGTVIDAGQIMLEIE